ncbi:MAG: flagellin, partial [Planctomycetota bacterium]
GPIDLVASLTSHGNGVRIVDRNGRPLTLQAEFGSQAAEYLGLIPPGEQSVSDNAGAIEGVDRNYLQVDSVFTTLVRLRDALSAGDVNAMERAISQIDADVNRVTFARSDVGARQQGLELSQRSLENEDVQLRSALSDELDVDLVEAISNLTARQISLEASLRATANLMQLSLLSFL